ncbi:hypothetical protein FHEFKHOI_01395 [Candidatus Methanoperedenaceae archaeon GB50]|nr:MAG: hypothetical protein KBONHNOK_00327 [Candidatus Methanoperedenaceae archaeon GB50]CAD7773328.1 hypothetical protein AIOGIFDO_01390 [Candidatus Methanoperedenaceae archaeon GB37]CAD7773432.1 hypothetical protein FHEFKHOI_01395 [Candidatus Methanoperedenaceae archaeon GB50]
MIKFALIESNYGSAPNRRAAGHDSCHCLVVGLAIEPSVFIMHQRLKNFVLNFVPTQQNWGV